MIENHTILVSGGTGFIGRHLCKYLRKKGINVVDRDVNGDEESVLDVLDLPRLLTIDQPIGAIIHLAAKTSITGSLISPLETFYTNLIGTLNLLELARQKKIDKFINISTYVYGQPKYMPINEIHPVDPRSPYNVSKLLAEQLCQSYSRDFQINVVTLRPFYIYGPHPRPNSFVYNILDQITKKNENVVLSGEQTRRDFLFIDDFIELIGAILDNFPVAYGVYNVGYGKSHLLSEVTQILADLLNKSISIDYDSQMRPGDITDMVADISKTSDRFKWKPVTPLEQGLSRLLEPS